MKNAIYILLLLAFMTGCQKPNDTPPPAAVAHQFGMMGGSCYDYTAATYTAATNCAGMNSNSSSTYSMQNGTCVSSTGQQVATSFCTSTANGYYTTNGVCYSSSTNQQVAASLCTSTTNGYYMNNGVCYSSSTNQQVAANLCSANSQLPPQMPGIPMPPQMPGMPMPPHYQMGGPCYGYYIYNGNGYSEFGYCYGFNCRGYMLTEVASGRMVSCQ